MAAVRPNRAYDYIYDVNFTTSSAKDHQAQLARAIVYDKSLAPVMSNMFSELRHFPATDTVLKPSMLSADPSMGQDRRIYYTPTDVAGADRFKFFRRPILPYLSNLGGQIVYAKKKGPTAAEQQAGALRRPVTPFSRTVGIQTMFRESEAQTEPFSPEYILRASSQDTPPEVLALATLTYGHGLPASVHELEMIERARLKRAWEAALPKVVDEETFKTRLRMMEDMELYEWREREDEIQRLQDMRLAILTKVIEEREQENHHHHNARIERIWQTKLRERDAMLDKLQQKRTKAMRKIADKRAKVEPGKERRDIISEYANYNSKVYAPKARDGVFMDTANTTLKLDEELGAIRSYENFAQVESSLPLAATEMPSLKPPRMGVSPSAMERREQYIKQQLERMDQYLADQKKPVPASKPLRFLERIQVLVERPATPVIEAPTEETEAMEAAALLLQRLIRGRIAQNMMYQGKERRLDLINELSMRTLLRKARDEAHSPAGASSSTGAEATRAVQPAGDTTVDVQASMQTLQLSKPATAEAGADTDSYTLTPELEALFEGNIQAEYVGNTLDFITKQIVRLREERRVLAMVKLAERIRRIREAEESGRRQQEIKRQRLLDEIFRQTMHVHQDTVDTYLEDILMESVDTASAQQSRAQVQEYVAKLESIVDEVHKSESPEDEQVVLDLVHSFLLPEVEKETRRRAERNADTTLLLAAHQAVHAELGRLAEGERPGQPGTSSITGDVSGSSGPNAPK